MKEVSVRSEIVPYLPIAFARRKVNFDIRCEEGKYRVTTDVSKREMKKVLRIAWWMYLSMRDNIQYVCREDIGTKKSGVIPECERYYFEKAAM